MQLNPTLSPINRQGRNDINENWKRIVAECSRLQAQINILSGDVSVEEILQALEDAIANANTTVAALEQQVQQSIADNDTATQQAIDNLNSQLQTALNTISTKLTELETAITNAETATTNANTATSEAQSATTNALSAIADMQNFVSELGFIGVYDSTVTYDKNNMVRYQKAVYIALVDGLTGITPSDDGVNWRLVIRDGVDGTGAVSTVNNVPPDENGNVSLTPSDIGAASSTDLSNLQTEVTEHLAESKKVATVKIASNQSIVNNVTTSISFDTLTSINNQDFVTLDAGKVLLKKGIYAISGLATFVNNPTGARYLAISTTDGVANFSVNANAELPTYMSVFMIAVVPLDDTQLHCYVQQRSGNALDLSAAILNIVKLGDIT